MIAPAHAIRVATPDWPAPPLPLPDLPAVETLPDALLPEVLRPWIADAADRLQVPPEMLAAPAVVAAGAVIGRAVGIYPKRQDDWLVVANLWGVVIGPPGVLKSPAVREATRPVHRLARAASEAHTDAEKSAAIERTLILARIKDVETRAKRKGANHIDLREELRALHDELREHGNDEKRYMTQDPTVEKLGELLRHNPRGLLLLRDELAGWLRGLERAGREGDREFWLESWNGTGRWSTDRIGRGTIHVPALTMSVLGTTQPGKLARLLLDPVAGAGAGNDGLLQRFGVAVWPDVPPEWRDVDRWPDSPAREAAQDAYAMLANDGIARKLGAETTPGAEIPGLRLGDDALELMREWRSDLETRLRSASLGPWPAYVEHLSKYRSLAPALALITYALDVVSGEAESGAVTLAATQRAAAWTAWLDLHARRIYGVELEPGRRAARLLARRILSGDVADGQTVREITQADWSGLTDRTRVREGLADLERSRWLRVVEVPTRGRASTIVRLHPDIARRQPQHEDDGDE